MSHYRTLSGIPKPEPTHSGAFVADHWEKFLNTLTDKQLASVRWWLECGSGYRMMLSPLTAWKKWQIEADEKLKKSEKRRTEI